MGSINETAVSNGLQYLDDRGWSELIDPRWTIDVREELERSGLGLTEEEIVEICNVAIAPKPDWQTTERLSLQKWPTRQEQINATIKYNGYSKHTLALIDNYINDILNGRTNLDRFNQQEHAGLCLADSPLIGAYAVCSYARTSLEPSPYVTKSQGSPTITTKDMSEREFDSKLRQGLLETAKHVVEEHRRNNQPLIFSENGQIQYVDPFTVEI